jgi:asparagine synthase (glutamine-hydrolysing)
MIHRGPNDAGEWWSEDGRVGLGHRRLSILDLSLAGHQPMRFKEKGLAIVFNGEIYNYQDIRRELSEGNQWKGNSDTEVLLAAYAKWGTDCLRHLNGMFAFAIYDEQTKQLFIARDRAGKKPLYYYRDEHKLVFASELNCLKALLPLQMNPDHFYSYLRSGTFYGEQTPYQQVTEMPAGSSMMVDCTNLRITTNKWWNVHKFYLQQNSDDENTALEKVEHYLQQSVKRRLESSDIEVGCFLSGGIDSGLVTAMASKYHSNLKTFTVSFEGEYDEAPLAKLVAEKYGTNHTQINIAFNDLKNDLEKIMTNYGEPFFDSSAIPSYYVSKEAKKYVTVILNGDGADELFGGYRRYVPFARYDFFKTNNLVRAAAKMIHGVLPMPNQKKSKYNYLYRLSDLAAKNSLEVYLAAGVDIFEGYEQQIIHQNKDGLAQMRSDFEKLASSDMSGLKKIMAMDFNGNLFCDLLVKMDIANMAHSLEGRSPFLCKELMEYAPGLNDSLKINGTSTKYLLRTMAKKYLPTQLIHQPKRGFEIPLKNWVENDLQSIVQDYVGAPTALSRQMLQKDFLDGLLSNSIKIPAEKRAKMLWTLLSMEIWYKKTYLQ